MNKISKLKICDRCLVVLAIAMLISGIQLEVTHCNGILSVWVHIFIGLLFMGMIARHIFLHFGYCNWFIRFQNLKNRVTCVFWWVTLVTLITGMIALVHWLTSFIHAPIGGVHGKVGFLMMFFSAAHFYKRRQFFSKKVSGSKS